MPASPPPTASDRLREALNAINSTTLVGLGVALLGRTRPRRRPDGLILAEGFRPAVPRAGAVTIGNVVVTFGSLADLERRTPGVTAHEARHAWQYAVLGPFFLPLYGVASAWSWLRSGDPALRNAFERHAGLVSGGYVAAGSREEPALRDARWRSLLRDRLDALWRSLLRDRLDARWRSLLRDRLDARWRSLLRDRLEGSLKRWTGRSGAGPSAPPGASHEGGAGA